ncbi:MAG: hypothetical protein AAFR11_09955 [Pseudomonadota bacterium]
MLKFLRNYFVFFRENKKFLWLGRSAADAIVAACVVSIFGIGLSLLTNLYSSFFLEERIEFNSDFDFKGKVTHSHIAIYKDNLLVKELPLKLISKKTNKFRTKKSRIIKNSLKPQYRDNHKFVAFVESQKKLYIGILKPDLVEAINFEDAVYHLGSLDWGFSNNNEFSNKVKLCINFKYYLSVELLTDTGILKFHRDCIYHDKSTKMLYLRIYDKNQNVSYKINIKYSFINFINFILNESKKLEKLMAEKEKKKTEIEEHINRYRDVFVSCDMSYCMINPKILNIIENNDFVYEYKFLINDQRIENPKENLLFNSGLYYTGKIQRIGHGYCVDLHSTSKMESVIESFNLKIIYQDKRQYLMDFKVGGINEQAKRLKDYNKEEQPAFWYTRTGQFFNFYFSAFACRRQNIIESDLIYIEINDKNMGVIDRFGVQGLGLSSLMEESFFIKAENWDGRARMTGESDVVWRRSSKIGIGKDYLEQYKKEIRNINKITIRLLSESESEAYSYIFADN